MPRLVILGKILNIYSIHSIFGLNIHIHEILEYECIFHHWKHWYLEGQGLMLTLKTRDESSRSCSRNVVNSCSCRSTPPQACVKFIARFNIRYHFIFALFLLYSQAIGALISTCSASTSQAESTSISSLLLSSLSKMLPNPLFYSS